MIELGKIRDIYLGYGGYDNAMFGLTIVFEGKGWGTSDFIGWWSMHTKISDSTQWTESDRVAKFSEVMKKVNSLLDEAKETRLDRLKGKPVEVRFDNSKLTSWRILTEVL